MKKNTSENEREILFYCTRICIPRIHTVEYHIHRGKRNRCRSILVLSVKIKAVDRIGHFYRSVSRARMIGFQKFIRICFER